MTSKIEKKEHKMAKESKLLRKVYFVSEEAPNEKLEKALKKEGSFIEVINPNVCIQFDYGKWRHCVDTKWADNVKGNDIIVFGKVNPVVAVVVKKWVSIPQYIPFEEGGEIEFCEI